MRLVTWWYPAWLAFFLCCVQPLVEYWGHRLLHRVGNDYHREHHAVYGGTKDYPGDWYVRGLCALLLCAAPSWCELWMGLAKYEAMHCLAHTTWGLHGLRQHHLLHHARHNCNYSFSATWPDRLFGTYRPSKRDAAVE